MKYIGLVGVSLSVAGLLLVSCNGKVNPEKESLSVDPPVIEAPKDLASHSITVSSNVPWTASFLDAGGTEATWGKLDRSTGKGDATLTLRIFENTHKSPRTGSVVVKTEGGLTATVAITQKGDDGSGHQQATATLKIGTYNLRGDWLAESNEKNSWQVRKDRLGQSIKDCAFDVFGMQEVGSATQSWLKSTFSGIYSFQFFSPYSQSGSGDKGQGIGWRTDAFTMSNWHYFWLGDDPGTMLRNDIGSNGNFNRGGCCCVLTHKATGLKIFFMNTHGCMNSDCRIAYAPQYERMEKQFNPDGLPSFFVGDMNSSEDSEPGSPYAVFTSYWKDSYKEASTNKRFGAPATFNGYASTSGKSRIDMVFFRGGSSITIDTYTCKNTIYGGLYASDHFPVYVDATIID